MRKDCLGARYWILGSSKKTKNLCRFCGYYQLPETGYQVPVKKTTISTCPTCEK